MTKKALLLLLAVCLVLGFASTASARDIIVENGTHFHIVSLYINYDGHGHHWGENLLDNQLNSGDEVTLDIHHAKDSLFKIKVVEMRKGHPHEYVWHDVDLQDAYKITLRYDRDTNTTSFRIHRHENRDL